MTNQTVRCPKCDQPLTEVGEFLICPEHGQASTEKLFVPVRIFLSYGHDSNEELVRLIKADLEKRGHDVWFDKSEIKFGHDWRLAITQGIVDSHRVLSFFVCILGQRYGWVPEPEQLQASDGLFARGCAWNLKKIESGHECHSEEACR
jgi:hypothetical protein